MQRDRLRASRMVDRRRPHRLRHCRAGMTRDGHENDSSRNPHRVHDPAPLAERVAAAAVNPAPATVHDTVRGAPLRWRPAAPAQRLDALPRLIAPALHSTMALVTLLADLVDTSQRVGASAARLVKIREPATLLAALRPAGIEVSAHYLAGGAPPGSIATGLRTPHERD